MDESDIKQRLLDHEEYKNLPPKTQKLVDRLLARAFRRGIKEGKLPQEIVDVGE